jgi:hypothetical protein
VVDVIGSLKKHVERQQSENREARASAASVKEEDHEEELNVEAKSQDDVWGLTPAQCRKVKEAGQRKRSWRLKPR